MKRTALVSLVLALTVLPLLVWAQQTKPAMSFERDVVYGKSGETDLLLDMATPATGDGPFPTVVFLHGGGWKAGSRHDMNHFIEGVARMGYVGVTVEYRLVPTAHFPAQVEDCKTAVRWLRANAKKYRIDPDRIGVVGFSAGGHLACMLGVTDKNDGLEGEGNPDQSSRVQAVVSFCGPTDFTTRDWTPNLERDVIVPFLDGSFADKPDVYKKASPISYITKDDPPFLFFHGTQDQLVPVDQSKRMAKKLKKAGVPAEAVVLEGEHHGFSNENNQKAMKQMMEFLGERLKK